MMAASLEDKLARLPAERRALPAGTDSHGRMDHQRNLSGNVVNKSLM
jgi:hypothetical protein